MEPIILQCDMSSDCTEELAYIDDSGFAYCTDHGQMRQQSGRRCRKLRPHELNRLKKGLQLKSY